MDAWNALEKFLALLFGAIVIMLFVKNASGVGTIVKSFGTFSHDVVSAFGGGIGSV